MPATSVTRHTNPPVTGQRGASWATTWRVLGDVKRAMLTSREDELGLTLVVEGAIYATSEKFSSANCAPLGNIWSQGELLIDPDSYSDIA
jgi:hypothetical protein